MSGIEAVLISCVAVNTALNVIQSSGALARFNRWFRLCNSRLITVTNTHNPNIFYQITKYLNKYSAKLRLRTIISFGDAKESHVYFVPDRNTEIKIPTKYGSVWIKVISLDGYHICAYEITCYMNKFDAIDKLFIEIFESVNPHIPNSEIIEFKKMFAESLEEHESKLISKGLPDILDVMGVSYNSLKILKL
ncbi:MAG: hypothetical protein Faunusvirus2_47 [Faunusvirus sp.]|uniref:Uncharacterized protein n=1 Tax=Faunusvirus sp. TaxID=2487766 RepID=A0A3G4ZW77_9VIRU|nr:MAG: hypothetical protein Faunusvirus2_47 [Faunusvirus sp.]